MSSLARVLRRITGDLEAARWALVGGLAVSARVEPRFTRDVDVAVAVPDDAEAGQLVLRLSHRGYRAIATVEERATSRLATVRLLPPQEHEEGIVVDLLFASSGIEPELVSEADAVEIVPGVVVPVAQVGHLIALKVLSRNDVDRPQDRVDLIQLLRAASRDELDRAVSLLDLIATRGFDRGRALQAELRALAVELGIGL